MIRYLAGDYQSHSMVQAVSFRTEVICQNFQQQISNYSSEKYHGEIFPGKLHAGEKKIEFFLRMEVYVTCAILGHVTHPPQKCTSFMQKFREVGSNF